MKDIEKEVRTIEVSTEGIRLTCEKIDNYFIRVPTWSEDILADIELEDIRIVGKLLLAVYEEFKKLEK